LTHIDIGGVLRAELERRGYEIGGDTVGLRGELYVRGVDDLASALFEFKSDAEEACRTMYQGSWLPSMPPRFAVLPADEKDGPGVELLAQCGLRVLFYRVDDESVTFESLEEAMAQVDAWAASR
jgi:hypothetical protein